MTFISTHDRFPGPRERWAYLRSRVAEMRYARQLRALAKHIGDLAKGLHAQAWHEHIQAMKQWASGNHEAAMQATHRAFGATRSAYEG